MANTKNSKPEVEPRERLPFTTKVLASMLVFLTVVLFGGMVWLSIESSRTAQLVTSDYKSLVRICLQTPGCVVPDEFMIDRIDCIQTETDEYWQIRYRDGTTSIVTTTCSAVQRPVPAVPDQAKAPEA